MKKILVLSLCLVLMVAIASSTSTVQAVQWETREYSYIVAHVDMQISNREPFFDKLKWLNFQTEREQAMFGWTLYSKTHHYVYLNSPWPYTYFENNNVHYDDSIFSGAEPYEIMLHEQAHGFQWSWEKRSGQNWENYWTAYSGDLEQIATIVAWKVLLWDGRNDDAYRCAYFHCTEMEIWLKYVKVLDADLYGNGALKGRIVRRFGASYSDVAMIKFFYSHPFYTTDPNSNPAYNKWIGDWSKVENIPPVIYNLAFQGYVITTTKGPPQRTLKYPDNAAVFYVSYSGQNWITSVQSFEGHGFAWDRISEGSTQLRPYALYLGNTYAAPNIDVGTPLPSPSTIN